MAWIRDWEKQKGETSASWEGILKSGVDEHGNADLLILKRLGSRTVFFFFFFFYIFSQVVPAKISVSRRNCFHRSKLQLGEIPETDIGGGADSDASHRLPCCKRCDPGPRHASGSVTQALFPWDESSHMGVYDVSGTLLQSLLYGVPIILGSILGFPYFLKPHIVPPFESAPSLRPGTYPAGG